MAIIAVAPATATSWRAPLPLGTAEPVRMVCDEWDRCWEQPEYGYRGPDYGYSYDDERSYQSYQPARPPTKWERKGFCPPGQHKKGNC